MNVVQKLLTQSVKTFASVGETQNLDALRSALRVLDARDVGLCPSDVPPKNADCGYLNIAEHRSVTVCVFVLRQGARLPLHNHPGMTGLLKVLYGRLQLDSFTLSDTNRQLCCGDQLPATFESSSVVSSQDPPCVLTPSSSNVHEIYALEHCAFLDVLSPPYNMEAGRSCNYFRAVNSSTKKEIPAPGTKQMLEVTPVPQDFYTEPMLYAGLPTGLDC